MSEEGRKKRDAGVSSVAANTPEWWKASVQTAIAQLAATGKEFTAEDVRRMVGDPPNHPNAMGAQFMAACKANVIRRVRFDSPVRSSRHANHIGVWIGVET